MKSIGYNETSQTLEIEFNNGSIYTYSKVPKKLYEDLMNAESKGKFFHKFIKKQFEFVKLD